MVSFFESFDFLGSGDVVRDPKWTTKPLGWSREGINGLMCLKFGIFITWVNPWSCFFFYYFFENYNFWALGTQSRTINGLKIFKAL